VPLGTPAPVTVTTSSSPERVHTSHDSRGNGQDADVVLEGTRVNREIREAGAAQPYCLAPKAD